MLCPSSLADHNSTETVHIHICVDKLTYKKILIGVIGNDYVKHWSSYFFLLLLRIENKKELEELMLDKTIVQICHENYQNIPQEIKDQCYQICCLLLEV